MPDGMGYELNNGGGGGGGFSDFINKFANMMDRDGRFYDDDPAILKILGNMNASVSGPGFSANVGGGGNDRTRMLLEEYLRGRPRRLAAAGGGQPVTVGGGGNMAETPTTAGRMGLKELSAFIANSMSGIGTRM